MFLSLLHEQLCLLFNILTEGNGSLKKKTTTTTLFQMEKSFSGNARYFSIY